MGGRWLYEMIKRVKEYSGSDLEWQQTMPYPTLHPLEGASHPKWQWQNIGSTPKRKYRLIIAEGRKSPQSRHIEWAKKTLVLGCVWNLKPNEI